MFATQLINRLLISTGKGSSNKYYSGINQLINIQNSKLLSYLLENQDTVYGKKYHFAAITNYAEYAAALPLIEDWQQVENFVQRVAEGEENVLYKEKTIGFEETSGSTGSSRLIPYTKSLKKEFQSGLAVWMLDLKFSFPGLFRGKSYWSLSPVLKESKFTSGGFRIGMESDADYFNPVVSYLLSKTMAVKASITGIKDPCKFYFETLKSLLLTSDLSFISVWSPTFFLQLNKSLRENWKALLDEVKLADKNRYATLVALPTSFTWKEVWPELACLSCWKDAQAGIWISRMQKILGEVPVQGKGLLSTEAIITVPIKNEAYPALCYRSHFFEFRCTATQTIFLAHQLLEGNSYEVITTTGGGLYRYCTKDIVKVMGFHKSLPLLTFLGRGNRTSDLVGEKVSETHLNALISSLLNDEDLTVEMIFIRPRVFNDAARYIVYIEEDLFITTFKSWDFLARKLETLLSSNPYYLQALQTGQLLPMQCQVLEPGFKVILTNYYRNRKHVKEGDIKLPLLFKADELTELNHLL